MSKHFIEYMREKSIFLSQKKRKKKEREESIWFKN